MLLSSISYVFTFYQMRKSLFNAYCWLHLIIDTQSAPATAEQINAAAKVLQTDSQTMQTWYAAR